MHIEPSLVAYLKTLNTSISNGVKMINLQISLTDPTDNNDQDDLISLKMIADYLTDANNLISAELTYLKERKK